MKIRGFRIEPGEIETALRAHPAVAQAAVLARDDGPAGRQLVAYVAPVAGESPDASDLRSHLAALVPEYMVPASFVMLESLPLSQSGKLDRHALPDRTGARPDLKNAFAPARSQVEELLTRIWCELLALDHVGIRDDFFELGGHSLLVLSCGPGSKNLSAMICPSSSSSRIARSSNWPPSCRNATWSEVPRSLLTLRPVPPPAPNRRSSA